jgi:hypothetical protein
LTGEPELLPAAVLHDISGADVLDGPGRREAAWTGIYARKARRQKTMPLTTVAPMSGEKCAQEDWR